MKRDTVVYLLSIIIVCVASPARSEEITSQQVDIAAPKVTGSHPEFLARNAPKTFQQHLVDNFKQSMMGENHREGPPLRPGPIRNLRIAINAATVAPRELDLMAAHIAEMGTSNPHPAAPPASIIRQVKILDDHTLADSETNAATSSICEPSIAFRHNSEVLVTGNWFSCFSKDGGKTYTFVDPEKTFPETEPRVFCCDQVAIYDPAHDLMIWLLQYMQDKDGNFSRLAVATGSDITNQKWHYYDFSPQHIGNWTGEWFDFPDLAVGKNYLYFATNCFDFSKAPKRAVLIRIPLSDLVKYQATKVDYIDTGSIATLDQGPLLGLRLTQGATDTMYCGTHLDLSDLRVFSWPENSQKVTTTDVPITSWLDDDRITMLPDARVFLNRCDGRITAAWKNADNIGFSWTASQGGSFHFPYIRAVVMDKQLKVVAEPDIWSDNVAYTYPAVATNSDGVAAISLQIGGPQAYPSSVLGILNEPQNGKFAWNLLNVVSGKYSPCDYTWGDYLTVRQCGPDGKEWIAPVYTLQDPRPVPDPSHPGMPITPPAGDRQTVQLHVIHFAGQ